MPIALCDPRGQPPIVMYHDVARLSDGPDEISPARFKSQLAFFARHGFTAVSMGAWWAARAAGADLPAKPVILTFDDAYEGVYANALPLLKRYGMTATLFVISGRVGEDNRWDDRRLTLRRHMTWEQLADWSRQGMEIGAHSVSHPALGAISDAAIRAEIAGSLQAIGDRLGIPVEFFAYPYGDFNARVKEIARDAGCKAALAVSPGPGESDAYALRRVAADHPPWKFALKLSPLGPLLWRCRDWETSLRRFIRRYKGGTRPLNVPSFDQRRNLHL